MNIRIGNGIDVHRFADKRQEDAVVVLGGVAIPHEYPLLAHSDGDVLSHALADALLGALSLGDIGQHFPPADDRYKGADSLDLLQQVYGKVQDEGWQLVNADLTVVAQNPRLGPHRQAIRDRLAAVLAVAPARISVKATTTEGLGFTGREEGIAVYASVLLGPR